MSSELEQMKLRMHTLRTEAQALTQQLDQHLHALVETARTLEVAEKAIAQPVVTPETRDACRILGMFRRRLREHGLTWQDQEDLADILEWVEEAMIRGQHGEAVKNDAV